MVKTFLFQNQPSITTQLRTDRDRFVPFNKNMYDYLKIVRHLGGGSEAIVWHLGGYCLAPLSYKVGAGA